MLNIPQEIKDLLHLDTCKKNIRIHFPNGERSDICNDQIVMNSVTLKESLCSRDSLQFGLSEAPVFECEVVGVGNVSNCKISVYCEVFCDKDVSGSVFRPDIQAYVYPVQYGSFIVDSCERQADINHRKIVAYGGASVLDWSVCSGFEISKGQMGFSSRVAYNPNIVYFCAENRIPFSDDIYDVTDMSVTVSVYSGDGQDFSQYMKSNYTLTLSTPHTSPNCDEWIFGQWGSDTYNQNYDSLVEVYGTQDNIEEFENKILNDVLALDCIKDTERDNFIQFMINVLNLRVQGYYRSNNPTYVNAQYTQQSTEPLPVLFYPYIENLMTQTYGTFTVMALKSTDFTVNVKRNSTTIYNETFQYHSDVKVRYKQLKAEFPDERVKFDRRKTNYGWQIDYSSGIENTQDLLNAYMERCGLFGKYGRDGFVHFINIKRQFGLIPSGTLYPDVQLYPIGVIGGKIHPNDYQSCRYDDEYNKQIGAILCEYDDSVEGDSLYLYYLQGYDETTDPNSYRVYDLSSNEIIRQKAWGVLEIGAICQYIENNISGVTYMPVDFIGRGLPYVEPGDTFEILTKSNESITTIVLNRTLSGEQALTDIYKSV